MQTQEELVTVEDAWVGINDSSIERVRPVSKENEAVFHQKEIEAVRLKSYEEGYQVAKLELEEKLKKEYEFLADQGKQQSEMLSAQLDFASKQNELLASINDRITEERIKFIALFEENFKDLLASVCHGILRSELTIKPEKLTEIIKQAISLLNQNQEMTIHIHPDHESLVKELMKNESNKLTFVLDSWLSDSFDFYVVQEHTHLNGELKTVVKESILSAYQL